MLMSFSRDVWSHGDSFARRGKHSWMNVFTSEWLIYFDYEFWILSTVSERKCKAFKWRAFGVSHSVCNWSGVSYANPIKVPKPFIISILAEKTQTQRWRYITISHFAIVSHTLANNRPDTATKTTVKLFLALVASSKSMNEPNNHFCYLLSLRLHGRMSTSNIFNRYLFISIHQSPSQRRQFCLILLMHFFHALVIKLVRCHSNTNHF